MSQNYNYTYFKLQYSNIEWEILERMAQYYGSKTFRQYLNLKLNEIASMPLSQDGFCSDCGDKHSVKFNIPAHVLTMVQEISERNCIQPGKLISRLVVHPLLLEHYEKNGF